MRGPTSIVTLILAINARASPPAPSQLSSRERTCADPRPNPREINSSCRICLLIDLKNHRHHRLARAGAGFARALAPF